MPQLEPPQLPDYPCSRSDAVAMAEYYARRALVRGQADLVANDTARSVAWSTLAIALGQDTGEL